MNKPILIDFEGLDCSFKETNSKKLVEFLGNDRAKRYSFPAYDSESSYFIRNYLSGEYKDTNINLDTTLLDMFMLDIFDHYHREIKQDIKNGMQFIIFDRFWYSNTYYFEHSYSYVFSKSYLLDLPKCDIIFKMMPEQEVLIDCIHKKANKDINESDDDLMRRIYDIYRFTAFHAKTHDIHTSKDGKIRSREDIFNDIIENLKEDKIIDESDINAFYNRTSTVTE